jgi:hypothetical protein
MAARYLTLATAGGHSFRATIEGARTVQVICRNAQRAGISTVRRYQ